MHQLSADIRVNIVDKIRNFDAVTWLQRGVIASVFDANRLVVIASRNCELDLETLKSWELLTLSSSIFIRLAELPNILIRAPLFALLLLLLHCLMKCATTKKKKKINHPLEF